MTWHIKTFQELTASELYAILRIRAEIFVVEQTCVYQDVDNKDQKAYHLWTEEDGIEHIEMVREKKHGIQKSSKC